MRTCPRRPLSLATAAGLAIGSSALGQVAPDRSHEIPWRIDSGNFAEFFDPASAAREPVVLWDHVITVTGSPWMRVHFGAETRLAFPDRHRGGSYLLITSVEDGARHVLDAATLPEWDNISAYLNGDTLLVQLVGPPGNGDDRVVIEKVTAGLPGGPLAPRSICGATDDRIPYNDPRVGRLSTGCTGWLITANGTSNEFLTAGHCINNGQTGALMMFNVPPATSTGSFVAPPPEFQFPVQSASIQSLNNAAVGDEYARFSTNNNSNTGLAARIAQGRSAFVLASSAPSSGTAPTTVRGNGIVNDQGGIPAVPQQWQRINKTHTAPYAGRVGTRINYMTDTDNANSGSPVTQFIGFPLALERAIGIHTDGFCPGTFNSGTAIDHPGLQSALASPDGIPVPYDSAVSRGITTTLASNNGGSDGGSIFFDVITGNRSIEVTSILLNINRQNASNNGTTTEDDDFFNFDVYIRPGTADGFETSSAGWTHVADGAGMPKPEDEYTLGALKDTFTLNASQHYGVAIVFDDGAGHAYTNATGSNETYSNADLTLVGISASNSAFGSNINGRVFNGGLNYQLNQAFGQCLETVYANNNNGSNGGMVYFNVITGSQPVTLTRLNTNVEGAGGLNCELTIYRKTGTHVGFETNSGAWTQVATASGVSAPIDTPSSFDLSNYVHLSANTTYGFAIELETNNGVGSSAHAYTNGNGLNQSYSDGRITINTGSATNAPFTSPVFEPRVWNGSFCYGLGLSFCASNIVNQSLPNTAIGGLNSQLGGQEEADNFGSPQNMVLSSATAWGYYIGTAPAPLNQDFVVRVFSETGGLPGALVASRSVSNVPLMDTGMVSSSDRPIYQYHINFADINLPPGSYWISILGNEPGYTWTWNRTNSVANAHAFRNGAGPWQLSSGDFAWVLCGSQTPVSCYANCDGSTVPPVLNVADFSCFLTKFAAAHPYANCDGSTIAPVLNVADFSCFLTKFAAGCP